MSFQDAASEIEALAQFLENTPRMAAEFYASGKTDLNGANVKKTPPVDSHFTHGGQAQYNFAPLSPEYAKAKAGQTSSLRKGMKSQGFTVSRAQGGNLPILVRTGKLRAMVASMKHVITQSGDIATITFTDLPDYAEYLHTGTDKMPARSPVNPGPKDLQEIDAELKKRLSVLLGTGQKYGQVMGMIPGVVRMA